MYFYFTRLRQDAPCGSTGRIGLRQRPRPDKMARGDRGVARRAKPGFPRHSFATAGGSGVVPLGFATDAPPCGRGASLQPGQLHKDRFVVVYNKFL
jgi:hypothetical protein